MFRSPQTASPPSDLADLHRCTTAASVVAGWRVQEDPDTGQLVAHADSGVQYVVLADDPSAAGASCIVEPRASRWELSDPNSKLIGSFRTLRDALERPCRTIMSVASPGATLSRQ